MLKFFSNYCLTLSFLCMEQIDGSTPTECWKKIYARLEKSKQKIGNGLKASLEKRRPYKSGSYMFGFSNKRIASLIQASITCRRLPFNYITRLYLVGRRLITTIGFSCEIFFHISKE